MIYIIYGILHMMYMVLHIDIYIYIYTLVLYAFY